MVNVTARINARKIVLSYFYEYCFFYKFKNQGNAIRDILFLDNIFQSNEEKFEQEKKEFLLVVNKYFESDFQDKIDYYVANFYDKRPGDTIDFDYIEKVASNIEKYMPDVVAKIDEHSQTFGFSKMDSIDQAIFTLGYIERKELGTIKEILLNELVELSKRYADDGSSRLINGIMHNILS